MLLYPRPAPVPAAVYEGTLADTGATVYAALTGNGPSAWRGCPDGARPSRGWRAYTPAQPCPDARPDGSRAVSGPLRPRQAPHSCGSGWGPPRGRPSFLGSGLAAALRVARRGTCGTETSPSGRRGKCSDIPTGWSSRIGVGPAALLEGRTHGYEGYDLSELQLAVATLARWGVERVLLTTSCGAVAPDRRAGDVVFGLEVLDCPDRRPVRVSRSARPLRLKATSEELGRAECWRRREAPPGCPWECTPAFPGPQYETDAELELLRALGRDHRQHVRSPPNSWPCTLRAMEAALLGVV